MAKINFVTLQEGIEKSLGIKNIDSIPSKKKEPIIYDDVQYIVSEVELFTPEIHPDGLDAKVILTPYVEPIPVVEVW